MRRGAASVLLLAYVAFISLGLPDTVLGVAWPSLRATFGLRQAAMGAVLAATIGGYFVSGLVALAGLAALLAVLCAALPAGGAGATSRVRR